MAAIQSKIIIELGATVEIEGNYIKARIGWEEEVTGDNTYEEVHQDVEDMLLESLDKLSVRLAEEGYISV